MLRNILDSFWSEYVWLPPNITWADITPGPEKSVQYVDYSDLIYPMPMALGVLIIRHLLDRFWFSPVGLAIGIKNTRPKKAKYNPVLEAAYQKSSKIKHKQIVALGKQVDLTERQVERWWRMRRSQDKPSTLVKFSENSFRFFYYLCIFVFGLVIMWDKPWLWDMDYCFIDYPNQGITNDIWWYYMISLSFYWSLTISQFFDVKRKDFWQMFIHHFATICLMAFSWVCNLHRIGSLVLLLHDCADTFLEAAKVTKYANYQKTCDIIFSIFTILWIITRIGIFPFYIIWGSYIRAPQLTPVFPAYYIFNSLLFLLLSLHIIWTWLILKVAYKALVAGQMEGDIRSSSSEMSDSSGTAAAAKEGLHDNHVEANHDHSDLEMKKHRAEANNIHNNHNNSPKKRTIPENGE